MNIRCFIGFHKWTNWEFIGEEITPTGFTLDVLERKCKRCGKNHNYTGISEIDILTGEKSPYLFKD